MYSTASNQIDLQSGEGQWQLLVLSFLQAGKIRRVYAERTFSVLLSAGLLDMGRLAAASPADRAAVQSIFAREYRGLVDRQRKAESLFANARAVMDRWGGRILPYLQRLPVERAMAELFEFRLFATTARWFARELRHTGMWPQLPAVESLFIDVPVRLALVRLGFAGTDPAKPWDVSSTFCQELVKELFGGDCLSLYRQGRYLCGLQNARLCLEECKLQSYCLLWQA